ncbi:PilZ domain-containing protein [Gilvimarinus sp. F26214L]|uniref:PilZ domain-containing protein n=1 Tax=Gilvimarinus sp. DZF01 TaxID=3461371 RepID=UPI004046494E
MDNTTENDQNKRSFTRLQVDTPAELKVQETGEHLYGICRDLSGGGMLIEVALPESGAQLRAGGIMEVRLASHWNGSPMLSARARVARVTPSDGRWVLGLEILEILD